MVNGYTVAIMEAISKERQKRKKYVLGLGGAGILGLTVYGLTRKSPTRFSPGVIKRQASRSAVKLQDIGHL